MSGKGKIRKERSVESTGGWDKKQGDGSRCSVAEVGMRLKDWV